MNDEVQDLVARGVALAQQRQLAEAEKYFDRAIALDANCQLAHRNKGLIRELSGDISRAVTHYQRALELLPDSLELHRKLAEIFYARKQFEVALPHVEAALRLAPDMAGLHGNLGSALAKLRRFPEAITAYRRALELEPDAPDFLASIGSVLMHIDKDVEAEACLRKAIELQPNNASSHFNFGVLLLKHAKLTEALAEYELALKLKPDYPAAKKARGLTNLSAGRYGSAWQDFDARIELDQAGRVHPTPRWDGSPLAGRTLLLEAEQGLGDTIQFIRYVRHIKRHHEAKIVFASQPALLPLLQQLTEIDVLISQKDPRPPFDTWSPLLSLPGVFHHDAATFPANIPYLAADQARRERWKNELAALPGRKIGIAWQGNPDHFLNHQRSIPLEQFRALTKLPNITLISLQKGQHRANFDQLKMPIVSYEDALDADAAFLDTAALMTNLDLVITADTSIAHLAGALGVPVWVALIHVPDWRWTMHGDRTPWYPTMRLFRQIERGNWPSVFHQITSALHANS